MPIPVCKFARAYFNKYFKDISSYGYYASKKEIYYGLKLHALITTNAYITHFILTVANVADRDALLELTSLHKDIKIIGEKGYISDSLSKEFSNERGILLLALQPKDSKKGVCKNLRNTLSKIRRRVETSFSQLVDQLNINRVLPVVLVKLKIKKSNIFLLL